MQPNQTPCGTVCWRMQPDTGCSTPTQHYQPAQGLLGCSSSLEQSCMLVQNGHCQLLLWSNRPFHMIRQDCTGGLLSSSACDKVAPILVVQTAQVHHAWSAAQLEETIAQSALLHHGPLQQLSRFLTHTHKALDRRPCLDDLTPQPWEACTVTGAETRSRAQQGFRVWAAHRRAAAGSIGRSRIMGK